MLCKISNLCIQRKEGGLGVVDSGGGIPGLEKGTVVVGWVRVGGGRSKLHSPDYTEKRQDCHSQITSQGH